MDVDTGDARPTKSQVITFNVVVAAGIATLVGCDDDVVPVEHVGFVPFVVYRNSLKLASPGIPCWTDALNAALNDLLESITGVTGAVLSYVMFQTGWS
jgi:hypothetical protein